MSTLKICRICLRTEAKGHDFDKYQLKYYYEEVMALKVSDADGLPRWFCYECASLLQKSHMFKEKCYVGQKLLREMLWRGPITYEAIYKNNQIPLNQPPYFEVLHITDRVKSYFIKDTTDTENQSEDGRFEVESKELDENTNSGVNESYENTTEQQSFMIDETDICGENIDSQNVCDEQNINNAEVDEQNTNGICDEPSSPRTVFLDVRKEIVKLDCEEIKDKKSEDNTGKDIIYHQGRDNKNIDLQYWKKICLNEDEAVEYFRARVDDEKYVSAAFKCTDCFRGFSKKDMLDRHRELRHNELLGENKCRFCRMYFKWKCHLNKHMKEHYVKYQCLRCNLICQIEYTAVLHQQYHSGVRKKCIYCNEEFRHVSTYYTHMRTHRSAFVCRRCGASFVSPAGLHQHARRLHRAHTPDSPDDYEDVNTYCELCKINFETRRAYVEHLFHSANHAEEYCDETYDDFNLPKKVLSKKEKAEMSRQLQKRITDDSEAFTKVYKNKSKRGKERTHRKPTTCHQCGERFDTQAACMKHHIEAHPRTSFHSERHICEICGASLAPGSVANHQNMHSGARQHACRACPRRFYSRVALQRHSVTHTGEKPYACPLCDKRFTQSNSLKLHHRTFHLKQPYPKRNRRKKVDENPFIRKPKPQDTASEESDESLPDAPPAPPSPPAVEPATLDTDPHTEDGTMHYLTLS